VKQVLDPVAGLDVHRDNVVAAVRMVGGDGEVTFTKRKFPTTRRGVKELAAFLTEVEAFRVAMEATGVYWKSVYYPLEGLFVQLWLCNAQHVKNVPGRKTDLSDAEWLADVAAHGMVRPSFVPPPEIRELRELTRYRKTQIDARAKEIQRLEKTLQDAGIKITSVASGVWSLSSRRIVEALIAGERNPGVLASLAVGKLRPKKAQLEEALDGWFGAHNAFVCRQVIDHIDFLDDSIAKLSEEIAARLLPFEAAVSLVCSVTGIGEASAQAIIAETGVDMSRFPTAGHLCAWAGVAPASHESAGKETTCRHPPRLHVAATSAHRGGPGSRPHQGQLLHGPVLPHRQTPWFEQGGRGRRQLDARRHLVRAHERLFLRRPRCRLLRAPSRSRGGGEAAPGQDREARIRRHHLAEGCLT